MLLRKHASLVVTLCMLMLQYSACQSPGSQISDLDQIAAQLQSADRALKSNADKNNAISFLGTTSSDSFLAEVAKSANKIIDEPTTSVRPTRPVIRGREGPRGVSGGEGPLGPPGSSGGSDSGDRGAPGIPGRARPSPILRVKQPECVFAKNNTDPCGNQYREPSGRCTNDIQGRRTWGMADTPYTRILSPKYENGVNETRKTEFESRKLLKSAREISTLVTDTRVELNRDGISSHIMQWGQFIAHEFTLIVDPIPDKECCPDKIRNVANLNKDQIEATSAVIKILRPECIPIENFNDPVHGKYHCMRMTRSQPAVLHDCSKKGPREQLNSITHIFDGSAIYGSNADAARKLRSLSGGKMKVQVVNGATLPPPANDGACPAARKQNNRCPFAAGDSRINVTPNLISLHAAFLLVHNKVATKLQQMNPNWNDEKLYQETKKIVSGIQSNIHFYEYLPLVVGNGVIRKHGLNSYGGYNSNVNPSIVNELATAGFRLHSLINGIFSLILDNGVTRRANLREQFFKFSTVYNGGIKQCIKGLTQDEPWKADHLFPTQMRDQLFRLKQDIVSFNIARGRDHGFASYMDYRRKYGLAIARNWDELLRTHSKEARDGLQKAYTNVEDIELYIGGTTEKPVAGGIVGELFANIIADGFKRTQNGDRFFFESSTSGLSPAQINEVKKYTYAHLLCEGAELQTVVNKAFFRKGSNGVQSVSCSSLSKINFDLWRESQNPVPITITPEPPVTEPTKTCEWQAIVSSRCQCNGFKTIIRRCRGSSRHCRCSGSPIVRRRCSPNPRRCRPFRPYRPFRPNRPIFG